MSTFAPSAFITRTGNVTCWRRIPFVEVEPAFHRDDRLAGQCAAHELPLVGRRGRASGNAGSPRREYAASAVMSSVSLPSPVPRMMPSRGRSAHFARTARGGLLNLVVRAGVCWHGVGEWGW